jgi:hypothetical protein
VRIIFRVATKYQGCENDIPKMLWFAMRPVCGLRFS